MRSGSRRSGALYCAVAMTILGSSFPVSGRITGYPTLTGQAVRYLVAALLLSVVLRVERRTGRHRTVARRDLPRLAALAATGLVGFNVCLLAALRAADAPVVGTVVGATPVVLAVLAPAVRRVRPTARLTLASLLVVGGVAVVEGGGHATPAGLAWALGALAGEASFSALAAPLLDELGAVRVSALACWLAVPQLVAAALVTGEWLRVRAPGAVEATALGYIAIVLTVGAFLCWYAGLGRLGVERAGMFAGVLPVTTLVTAAALDRTVPALPQVAGVLVVGAGLALGLWAPVPERRHGLDPTVTDPTATRPAVLSEP